MNTKHRIKTILPLAAVAAAFTLAPAAQAQWTESIFVNPGAAGTQMGNWDIDISNGIGIATPAIGAAGSAGEEPILFDAATGTLIRRLIPTGGDFSPNVMGVAIDGGLAVVTKQSSHFVLFDVATGNEIGRVDGTSGCYGSSAAISGNLVAIGGCANIVDVYDVSNPAAIVSLGTVPGRGNHGFALSGNTLVSGASPHDVSVYTVGATSIGAGTLLTPPAGGWNSSGRSGVGIDGDMVIVGMSGTGTPERTGTAYLFDLSVGTTIQAVIAPDGPGLEQRRFGYAVGISGDTVIVGSGMRFVDPQFSEPGEAYLFDISDVNAITQIQKLTTGNTLGDDRFAYEGGVAIDGNFAVVAASGYDIPGGNSDVGAAYIYTGSFSFQPFAITEIQYDPDADPPTVTLTWRSRSNTTYSAFSSLDLSDWSNELADSLGIDEDENPDDGNHITVTFPLENGLEDATDLFLRIQEE